MIEPELAQQILVNPELAPPEQVREALLLLTKNADFKLIGVCAETLEQAVPALYSYCRALGYPDVTVTFEPIEKPGVFVKFNPKTWTCYAAPYEGTERGVIVSCFSPYTGSNNETYGNVPLDLFGTV